jgi:hypothetical protein
MFIVGITCAKYGQHRAAERQRRLQQMVAHGDSVTQRKAAQHDSEQAERRLASAPACPAPDGATDFSSWAAVPMEGYPLTVPEVPSFEVTHRERSSRPGQLDLSSSQDGWYRVTYSDHEERLEDWQQYERVAECADATDMMSGMIQTARDTHGGLTKLVFASYRLPDGHYLSFRGTTNDVAIQAQFVTAAHHLRLNQ